MCEKMKDESCRDRLGMRQTALVVHKWQHVFHSHSSSEKTLFGSNIHTHGAVNKRGWNHLRLQGVVVRNGVRNCRHDRPFGHADS